MHWLLWFAQVFLLTKWIGTVRPPCFFGNFLIFPTCRSSVFKMSFSLLSEPGLGSPIKSKKSFLFCATEFADKDAFLMIDGFAEVRFRRKPATCFWCRGQSVRVSSSSLGWNDISMKNGASFSRHLVSIPSRSVQESDISFSAAKDWPKSTTSIASTMRWSTEISQVVCQECLCESHTSWNFYFFRDLSIWWVNQSRTRLHFHNRDKIWISYFYVSSEVWAMQKRESPSPRLSCKSDLIKSYFGQPWFSFLAFSWDTIGLVSFSFDGQNNVQHL